MPVDDAAPVSLLAAHGLDAEDVRRLIAPAFVGADDGELFIERQLSEMLGFDNGRLKTANFDSSQGFGLRAVSGEIAGYAHSTEVSHAALGRAVVAVSNVTRGRSGAMAPAPTRRNEALYGTENPIDKPAFGEKVALLQQIDAYARQQDSRVIQVSVSLGASWQHIEILRADGWRQHDIRPL
ncbi:MAG: metalloprotease TldD, partial [Hyphomicrobiales bacterium]|nr:metalloprotease TldD [Hyphomicrobiales bacterium]